MIFPVALDDPKVMLENPLLKKSNSASVKCKSPAAVVPKPMVVEAVFGAIVSVDEPEIAAPSVIASVLMVSALEPMAIVPEAPVVKAADVMVVAPNGFVPPTAPFMVTVPPPALMVRARAVLVELLRVLLKVTLLSVVVKVVALAKETAPL